MRVTTADRPATSRPRILLVTHYYPPEQGAPQRRWDALTPRFIRAGMDLTVLAPPPHYPTGRAAHLPADLRPGSVSRGRHGERVVRVRFRPHTSRLVSRTMDQAVAAGSAVWWGLRHLRSRPARPHIVVGTVPGIPSMFAAWALARLLRARLVVEMRDAWPDLIGPSGIFDTDRPLRSRVLACLRAAVHRSVSRMQTRADTIVTTTEAFAEVLLERGARRVAVVRNGTSFRADHDDAPVGNDVPATWPCDRHRRPLRAVYAGTVGRAQDLESVVRAAATVSRRGLPIEVRIVGTGSEVPTLRRLAAELGAPVTFTGRVPHAEVGRFYAWADTVIVCLQDWKPLEWTVPSKLYEVMASGSHTTACVAGEAAALVERCGAGTVVPPGRPDELAEVWSAWARGANVPESRPGAARWVAENAHDDLLAAKYIAVLRELLPAELGTVGARASEA